jgi:hypothetical protein
MKRMSVHTWPFIGTTPGDFLKMMPTTKTHKLENC